MKIQYSDFRELIFFNCWLLIVFFIFTFVSDQPSKYHQNQYQLTDFGRLNSYQPTIIPSDDLRYAQVVKTRKGGILQKVEKKVIFGENIDEREISTTLIERQNLTFRQDNNRVSRKTIGFSKVKEWLEYQMRLYCTHFNFCRGHGGLKYKDERGIKSKNTPARKARITNSKWTLKQLLKFRSVNKSIE